MKNITIAKHKFINLFLVFILICSMIPAQATEGYPTFYNIVFDPDDGITQYQDFYKTTVEDGSVIVDIPDNPKRDGYLFKGWYYALDKNDNPILWDFGRDKVFDNTTLWAAWEEGCIVVFDPDNGKAQYQDFDKTTVKIGAYITDTPSVPKRDGYLFRGWYYTLDEEDNPVFWDFDEHKVFENTTLWAAWEKGCIVAFDPDDGITEYQDFYKTTVEIGKTVTDIPQAPKRDGYVFQGWYYALDKDGKPIFWNFGKEPVLENTTLWASWKVSVGGGGSSNGGGNGGSGESGNSRPQLEKEEHYRYILGYDDNTIRPENNITREETATVLFRLMTKDSRMKYRKQQALFTDIDGERWSAMSIATLENAGIVKGYNDGSFQPESYITRAEFSAMVMRFSDLEAGASHNFTDINGHWAEAAIASAVEYGWAKGYPDGSFRPESPITRVEVMTLINRILERQVDEYGILSELIEQWTDLSAGHWGYYDILEACISHSYTRQHTNSALEQWIGKGPDLDFEKE